MPAAAALLLATSIALLLVVVYVVYLVVAAKVLPGPVLTGKTVVIHTCKPDDQSIRGVLVAQHADRLVLREGVYLYGSGDQEIGGLVHVPVANVSFVQEIG